MSVLRRSYEEILWVWSGWGGLRWMAVRVLWARTWSLVVGRERMVKGQKITTFVNAAVVGGAKNEL